MLPAIRSDSVRSAVRQAQREIVLWTTKDGREIPLDDMTDDHIANAVRVLSVWRMRLKRRDRDNPVIKDLADAIDRFKRIMRQRKKVMERRPTKLIAGRNG